MGSKLQLLPCWAGAALQGITYWVGHRRSLYPHYPLAEAALVAETCNLIHANLSDDLELRCEVQYSKLITNSPLPDIIGPLARIDLAVGQKDDKKKLKLRYAIEVKRASAPAEAINSDLRRLASLRRIKPNVRAFLFIISEGHRPKRFVTPEGTSVRGETPIPNDTAVYRVRRTWKAAHAFKFRDKVTYACLIEVFPK